MTYRVEITPAAERDIRRLPADVRSRVETKLRRLPDDPRPPGVQKLRGDVERYRIRVGNYRLVYDVEDALLLVVVVGAAHRRDVYRKLR